MHNPVLIRNADKNIYFSGILSGDMRVIMNAGRTHKSSSIPDNVASAPIKGLRRFRTLDREIRCPCRLNLKSKATVDEVMFIRSDM